MAAGVGGGADINSSHGEGRGARPEVVLGSSGGRRKHEAIVSLADVVERSPACENDAGAGRWYDTRHETPELPVQCNNQCAGILLPHYWIWDGQETCSRLSFTTGQDYRVGYIFTRLGAYQNKTPYTVYKLSFVTFHKTVNQFRLGHLLLLFRTPKSCLSDTNVKEGTNESV